MVSEAKALKIKRRHSAELLSQPGVSGVGVEKDDRGNFVLAVYVESDDAQVRKNIPDEIEGCPVKLVPSGPFRKLDVSR